MHHEAVTGTHPRGNGCPHPDLRLGSVPQATPRRSIQRLLIPDLSPGQPLPLWESEAKPGLPGFVLDAAETVRFRMRAKYERQNADPSRARFRVRASSATVGQRARAERLSKRTPSPRRQTLARARGERSFPRLAFGPNANCRSLVTIQETEKVTIRLTSGVFAGWRYALNLHNSKVSVFVVLWPHTSILHRGDGREATALRRAEDAALLGASAKNSPKPEHHFVFGPVRPGNPKCDKRYTHIRFHLEAIKVLEE